MAKDKPPETPAPKKPSQNPSSLILAGRLNRMLMKMPPKVRKWAIGWINAEFDNDGNPITQTDLFSLSEKPEPKP